MLIDVVEEERQSDREEYINKKSKTKNESRQ